MRRHFAANMAKNRMNKQKRGQTKPAITLDKNTEVDEGPGKALQNLLGKKFLTRFEG